MGKTLCGIVILLGIMVGGCAPFLRVDESGTQVSGRWTDPKNAPLAAYEKVARGTTALAELKALGFDPDADIVGGAAEPKDKQDEKKLKEKLKESNFKKPVKLDGPEAFRLYMSMLFPEGSSTQAVTEEVLEKRRAEVGQYTAYVFVMENVQNKKDRVYFSTYKTLKLGYRYEFKFVLKNGVVIEKAKHEQEFNDPQTEKSFGKGVVEMLKGIRGVIPIPFIP